MALATEQHRLPPWGMAATVAWVVLALIVSTLVAVGCYGLWLGDTPRPSAQSYDGVLISIGAMSSIPVQLAVLAYAVRLRRWPVAEYFALNVPRRAEIIMAVLTLIVLDIVFNTVLYVSGRDIVPAFQVEAYRTAKEAGWLLWLMVTIIVFAPVGEEIAFRGFLFRGLARPGVEMLAIVAIALAWSVLHIQYDWLGIVQVCAIGLLLGWFRWASGSTTLTILMHMLINLEAMIETAIKVEVFL